MERDGSESFTLFVDNLPVDVGIHWFRNFFNRFGVVKDAFIPSKCSKVTNRRFGFIRYNCATSADVAISKANGIWIEDRKLFVKFAAFKDQRKLRYQGGIQYGSPNDARKMENAKRAVKEINKGGVFSGKVVGKSFAEVVVGKHKVEPRRIIIDTLGNEWLSRSAVAKLKSSTAMESIREALHCKGVPQIEVKDMGGLWVVLTFVSSDQLQSVFDGELCWLHNWFNEIKKWSPEIQEVHRRNIWISCYGVPLHGWNALTFKKIAQLWGEVIEMDEATTKGLSFAAGKVMISTEKWDRIDEVIQVVVKGNPFNVRVVEEQVVIHGHCSFCNLDSTESTRSESSKLAKGTDSVADSFDEANSRRDVDQRDLGDSRKERCISNDVSRVEDSNVVKLVEELAAEWDACTRREALPIQLSSPKTNSLEEGEISEGVHQKLIEEGGNTLLGLGSNNVGEENLVFGPKFSEVCGNKVDGLGPIGQKDNYDVNEENKIATSMQLELNEEAMNADGDHVLIPYEAENDGPHVDNLVEENQASIQAAIKGVKGKKKRKTINEILGLPKLKQGSKKGGKKCVLFRSAVAAAALSASISSNGINNRNKILLDEAQAIWEVNKLYMSYDGNEEEVISKIAELRAQDNMRADCHL